jgi:hypothetical protein
MCRQIPGCEDDISEAVAGTKGFCVFKSGYHLTAGSDKLNIRDFEGDPYVQEHTDLIDHIRSGKHINELKNVAESTLTAIMGRMSAYTGQAVTWDKALNSKEDLFPKKLAWDATLPPPQVAMPGKTKLI